MGKNLHFKGSTFHRVIPGFMCQVNTRSRKNDTARQCRTEARTVVNLAF